MFSPRLCGASTLQVHVYGSYCRNNTIFKEHINIKPIVQVRASTTVRAMQYTKIIHTYWTLSDQIRKFNRATL